MNYFARKYGKFVNFEVWCTWGRLSISQLSVVLGKLIHLLEHITSTRIGLLSPQGKVLFCYPARLLKIHYWHRISHLSFSCPSTFISSSPREGTFHIWGPVLTMWQAGQVGEGNNHVQGLCAHWLAALRGCPPAPVEALVRPASLYQMTLSWVLIDLSLPRLLMETLGWCCHRSSPSKHY